MFQLEGAKTTYSVSRAPKPLTAADRKICAALKAIEISTEKNIMAYRLGAAARDLYGFFWHAFCDIYIEKAKVQIRDAARGAAAENTRSILVYVLANCLKLLHPFVPFVTEEIYSFLPVKDKKALIVEKWPEIK